MKNLSKALALFVVVAMMLTSVMSVAAFTDVDNGSTYARAINVDTALGLLNGYPDGTFQPEGSITRAEFAAVVVRMLGQEAQAAGSAAVTPYADVAADHWAAGYINIATQLGIINGYGDGNFGPEDPVLYEQAVKMVVIALGYGPVCDPAAYPVSYLTKAGQIGITTGLRGENGANANRGLVAQIVFNALDKPLMKETGFGLLTSYEVCDGSDGDKATVLDEYLDTVKILATVDSSTALTSTTNQTEKVKHTVLNAYKNKYGDEAGEEFTKGTKLSVAVGSTNASEYVGKKAIVYINYIDGYLDDAEIVYIEEDSSATESITSDQYEATSDYNGNYKVEYRENPSDRNTQSFLVSPTAKIYVNGVESNKSLSTELGSFYGKADFSLNDSSISADYDTVFITNYNTIVVDTVNTKTSRITSKNSNTLTYAKSDDTIKATLYDTNGDVMDWADLKEFDVVSYTETDTTTKNIVGYLVDSVVTGMVDGLSDGDYSIGGNEYSLNKKYVEEGDIVLGDEGSFYLDIMGNIVYFEEGDSTSGGRNYAYVKKANVVTDFDDALRLRLFTSDGKLDNYDLYTTVKYNGKSTKAEDMASEDKNANGKNDYVEALEGKLIAYKVNSSGLITSIDLPETWTNSSKRSDFTVYGTKKDESEYTESTGSFTTSKSKVYASDSTVIFIKGNADKEADLEIISLATLDDEATLTNASFYNVDQDLNVGVILAEKYESDSDTTPIAIAVSTGSTQDDDGYTIESIKAFSELVTTTFVTDSDNPVTLPDNGSVFIPKFKSGSTLKSITNLVNVNGSTVALGDVNTTDEYGNSANTIKYYFDDVAKVSTKRVTLDNGNDLVVPATANVYVVDRRIPTLKNRISVEDINYLDYVEEKDNKGNVIDSYFTDGGDDVTSYVMFAREVNGKIVDVVLYINYTIDK